MEIPAARWQRGWASHQYTAPKLLHVIPGIKINPHSQPAGDMQRETPKSYLMKPRNIMRMRLTSQPAVAKAFGMVRAPVPTIRLNM